MTNDRDRAARDGGEVIRADRAVIITRIRTARYTC